MLYIAKKKDLIIWRKNGDVAHKFSNGFLTVGDPTLGTTGNVLLAIDPYTSSDDNRNFQWVYPTDLSGNAPGTTEAYCLEAAGQGDILDPSNVGYTARNGMDANFWKAPLKAYGDTAVATGITYLVYSGSVVYNGVTYNRGQIFLGVGTGTDTTDVHSGSTGTFCNFFPFVGGAEQYRKEYFAQLNFCRPDMAQPNDHYGEMEYQIEPMVSTTSTDADFVGWTV